MIFISLAGREPRPIDNAQPDDHNKTLCHLLVQEKEGCDPVSPETVRRRYGVIDEVLVRLTGMDCRNI
jgi:hypothetical protein